MSSIISDTLTSINDMKVQSGVLLKVLTSVDYKSKMQARKGATCPGFISFHPSMNCWGV